MEGTLYVVATPIGNLGDITLRAIEILKAVDIVASEDTRRTGRLLTNFGIKARLVSYHDHNAEERVPALLSKLHAGKSVALASDAGTPLVSDPGYKLVRECIRQGIGVVPIPGASAVLAALTASGLPPYPFLFVGYLPRKVKDRRKLLEDLGKLSIGEKRVTYVAFEAPHRLSATLSDLSVIFGASTRVVLARDLTKRYEEFVRGSASWVNDRIAQEPRVRGEVTLVWV